MKTQSLPKIKSFPCTQFGMLQKGYTFQQSALKYWGQKPFFDKHNAPFKAKMKYVDMVILGSHFFVWQDQDSFTYFMFATELSDILKTGKLENGYIEGTWMVCKRNTSYGLVLIDD